jgi:hypothetical protein
MEKLMFDEKGNPFFRVSSGLRDDKTFKDVQPQDSSTPCVKELNLKIILKRSGYDPEMRPRTWYGVQDLQIKIPDEKQFRYYYLVYIPKAMSNVCVKILSSRMLDSKGNYNSVAYDMNLNPDKNSKEYDWVTRIGKAKTISAQTAQAMLDSKLIFGIFSDRGEQV